MLAAILLILVVLWFFGYIHVQGINIPNFPLFTLNGHSISLWDFLIFLVILWAIEMLPGQPLRAIAGILLLIWVLSTFGIIAVAGLAHLIVIVLIIGLILTMLGIL